MKLPCSLRLCRFNIFLSFSSGRSGFYTFCFVFFLFVMFYYSILYVLNWFFRSSSTWFASKFLFKKEIQFSENYVDVIKFNCYDWTFWYCYIYGEGSYWRCFIRSLYCVLEIEWFVSYHFFFLLRILVETSWLCSGFLLSVYTCVRIEMLKLQHARWIAFGAYLHLASELCCHHFFPLIRIVWW